MIYQYEHTLSALPEREVYRYMGVKPELAEDALQQLVQSAVPEFLQKAKGRGCYLVLPVGIEASAVNFGLFSVESKDLARNLAGCSRACLFAATLGIESERQRKTAAVFSPARALVLDAMGSAGIEEVCDGLCRRLEEQYPDCRLHPRFSPGYGDLPLALQKTILSVLDANRRIGVSLTDGMLMVPQKSVTAIVGLEESK